jgi:hypothetical protein
MEMKQAATELLKIADELEQEANEVTQFVCAKCNHTATLATINTRRVEAAQKAASDKDIVVSKITVNDEVSCPACGGVMAYVATEASEKFYIDPEKQAKDCPEGEKPNEEETDKEASAPVDYDNLNRYLGK